MFDFVPIAMDQMVLATISNGDLYLGGDAWLYARPFQNGAWLLTGITTVLIVLCLKILSVEANWFGHPGSHRPSEKVKKLVIVIASFFFMLILQIFFLFLNF